MKKRKTTIKESFDQLNGMFKKLNKISLNEDFANQQMLDINEDVYDDNRETIERDIEELDESVLQNQIIPLEFEIEGRKYTTSSENFNYRESTTNGHLIYNITYSTQVMDQTINLYVEVEAEVNPGIEEDGITLNIRFLKTTLNNHEVINQ